MSKTDLLELKINDEQIVIKPFVQEIMAESIIGMVKSLKLKDSPQTVEVYIRVSKL